LQEDEKKRLFSELREKELALHEARRELMFMRHRAETDQDNSEPEPSTIPDGLREYIRERVLTELGGVEQVATISTSALKRRFDSIKENVHPGFMEDLIKMELASRDGLELRGAKLFRRIARNTLMKRKC
jgi:hypothetical protein